MNEPRKLDFDRAECTRRVFEAIPRIKDVAEILGLTHSAVSNAKARGRCTLEQVIVASSVTGYPIKWFLFGERESPPELPAKPQKDLQQIPTPADLGFDRAECSRRIFEAIPKQRDLAEMLGKTDSAISNAKIRGRCSLELVAAAARMTGYPIRWLLFGEGDPPAQPPVEWQRLESQPIKTQEHVQEAGEQTDLGFDERECVRRIFEAVTKQKDLADVAGLHPSGVSNAKIRGRCSLQLLMAASRLTGCPVKWFLFGEGEPPSEPAVKLQEDIRQLPTPSDLGFDRAECSRRIFEAVPKQKDLADMLGQTDSAISQAKKRKRCSFELTIAASYLTGRPIDWFLFGEGNPPVVRLAQRVVELEEELRQREGSEPAELHFNADACSRRVFDAVPSKQDLADIVGVCDATITKAKRQGRVSLEIVLAASQISGRPVEWFLFGEMGTSPRSGHQG